VVFLRKHAFKLAVLALCAAMGIYLLWSGKQGEQLDVIKAAPDFKLTNLDGGNVTLADTDGKVRLFYFFFTNCPDACPTTTALMTSVQKALKEQGQYGKDVTFNWITIDPERDSPEAIKAYSERFDVDLSGWRFLRGDPKETVDLASSFGLMVQNQGGPEYLAHQDKLILVDRKGQVRKYISGSGLETAEQILKDITLALKD
jgi:protein SCO1/2